MIIHYKTDTSAYVGKIISLTKTIQLASEKLEDSTGSSHDVSESLMLLFSMLNQLKEMDEENI